MKICVVGAGAIGGLLGCRLANAGETVSLVTRGAHLDAIKRNGLRVHMDDGTHCHAPAVQATDDIRTPGPQDLVILCVKAHQIAALLPDLDALLTSKTTILTMQNGIPWWYFQRHGGSLDGHLLSSVDPSGALQRGIEPGRLIGGVAHAAAYIAEPGVIAHVAGLELSIGELNASDTARARDIAGRLANAGFRARVLDNIRAAIWRKSLAGMRCNPISALTRAMVLEICEYRLTHDLGASMTREAHSVASKLGIALPPQLEPQIAGAGATGHNTPTMLHEPDSNTALETEALMGVVAELGRLTDTPTPAVDAIYAAVTLLGEHPAPLPALRSAHKKRPPPTQAPSTSWRTLQYGEV